jgi:6-hydroxy-3-succinoylpyridine 3-monooxygenase
LHVLFRDRILPSSAVDQSELLGIKFFTAPILEKASKSLDSVSSQSRYHTALEKLYPNEIEIIKGYYSLTQSKVKIVDSENPNKWARECEEILVWKVEEKQTDVNLALHAYHDAVNGIVDQVVIVTNDTDIAPALNMIRNFTPVIIGVVIPTRDQIRKPNVALSDLAHWVRTHITDTELSDSQMPEVIIAGRRPTKKPISW